jgi:hypothetical protein
VGRLQTLEQQGCESPCDDAERFRQGALGFGVRGIPATDVSIIIAWVLSSFWCSFSLLFYIGKESTKTRHGL